MYVKGVAATSVEEILAASTAGKSQFYQHFNSKDDLVQDVIALRAEEILTKQTLRLRKLDSFRGLQQWRNAIVQGNALCPPPHGSHPLWAEPMIWAIAAPSQL